MNDSISALRLNVTGLKMGGNSDGVIGSEEMGYNINEPGNIKVFLVIVWKGERKAG